MSSESENDKERLVQAAKTFFFHIKDLTFFTNTLTELFNNNMNTQILSMAVKDNSTIKDSFEHMLRIFKDMQSVVKEKYNEMQKESLCSKFASAMCSMVEKSTNVKELQESAKEVFKNVHTPVIVSVLHNGNILGNLESSLSLLMTLPIMNLQLSDFYREDNKEQSEATTSQKTKSPGPSRATVVDILKKLQDALKPKNANNPTESAADLLEQIVKDMGPILEILQKVTNSIETDISMSFKKVNDK
uniref:Chromosome 12 open reading frame 60 n=1 Tax=Microcebus murinus TaxID=30608 RepID=A0A8C5UW23_MICMU